MPQGLTELQPAAKSVLDRLRAKGETLAIAESCTGGLLGAALTAVPGASDPFLGGIIAYHDRMKAEWLGVDEAVLDREGSVSEAVAQQMAAGARTRFGAAWAVAITGIAGPSGGSAEKPVGTVWIAVSGPQPAARRYLFPGDRAEVRAGSAGAALELLAHAMGEARR